MTTSWIRALPLVAALVALPLSAALADRAPTLEERGRIEAALRAAGFTVWDDVEFDDDGKWEIEDAVAADGAKYELDLDTNLNIIKRERQ